MHLIIMQASPAIPLTLFLMIPLPGECALRRSAWPRRQNAQSPGGRTPPRSSNKCYACRLVPFSAMFLIVLDVF